MKNGYLLRCNEILMLKKDWINFPKTKKESKYWTPVIHRAIQ